MVENVLLPLLIGMAIGANSVRLFDSIREKRQGKYNKIKWEPPYPPPPFRDRPKSPPSGDRQS